MRMNAYLINTSPSVPTDSPFWNSSVFANYQSSKSVWNAYGIRMSKIHLKVHVIINRNKVTLIFTTPLQLDSDRFTSELIKEGFRVNGNKLAQG